MKSPRRLLLPLLLWLAFASPLANAALQALLDRDRVEPGESVELTLLRDGRGGGQPDLAPLQRDFAILGQASGSSIRIVNGSMSVQTQLRLTLSPKHGGRIAIPSLNWGGGHSPALTLEVSGSGGGHADGGAAPSSAHVFLNVGLEQKQPYIQAATPLKVRIYTDQPLYQAGLDLPASNDVLVQQVGQDRQSTETRNGRQYRVIERNYLLFPQRSGRVNLAGPVLDAQIADTRASDPFANDPFFGNVFGRTPFAGMMNAVRPLRLQGDAIVLDVRPRPAAATGPDWLPAREVRLEEAWRPGDGAFHAGEPITRHLRLSALGLTAAQLPDLAARMVLPEGIKAYPDQAKLATETRDDGVDGSREQDIALIASQPGRYTLPALRLSWWDTARNSQREAVLPARTLEILPGIGGSGTAATPPIAAAAPLGSATGNPLPAPAGPEPPIIPGAMALPWPWISLALGLLWLTTLAAWWHARRAGPRPVHSAATPAGPDTPKAGAARKAFRQACADNDAAAARRHLLEWARAASPSDPPAGLNALARRLDDASLSALLRDLDRACYAGGEWRGDALAEALKSLPGGRGAGAAKPASALAPLYP